MEWEHPFNVVVITQDEILSGKSDVLLVMHDEGHGGWQFYDGDDVTDRKPVAIEPDQILQIDRSLAEVTDLPVGWLAKRENKQQPWVRERLDAEDESA